MKKAACAALLVASVSGAFAIGSWTRDLGATAAHAERRIHHYACPMHPTYTSEHPGIAPCCGMPYEPVYEDTLEAGRRAGQAPAGTIGIPAPAQQAVGVEVIEVQPAPGEHTVRLFGRVAADERRVFSLNAGIDGTILEVSDVTTGSRVRKNQLLATYSAPDFLLAIQSYILALDGMERRARDTAQDDRAPAPDRSASILSSTPAGLVINSGSSNFQQRLDRLHLLGMSDVQIDEIRRMRDVPLAIKIYSPADGLVISRAVSPNRKFVRGEEWFRVADLRRVWIVADVFGDDAARVRPGMDARVTLPGVARTLNARVSDVPLQYNAATSTRTVRLEVENQGDVLRPDMAVDVELSSPFSPAIVLPSEAVIDSGLKRTVFVERSPGSYEPREVETGWRRDGQIEIVRGLSSGDRVVKAGTFLLDSESQIRVAGSR